MIEIINSVGSQIMKARLQRINAAVYNPHETQKEVLRQLLSKAENTVYGKKYNFRKIKNYQDFQEYLPLIDYADLEPYLARLFKGEQNILWPSKIKWLAKSSGTTSSNKKLIPVSKESLEQCHYQGGRDMIALYMNNFSDTKLFTGKNLSIGGSQENNFTGGKNSFYTGNISAIVMKNLPFWAQLGRTPGLEVTMMNNWEEKIKKITEIATKQNVTSLAGSPMWMLLLLQHILKEKKAESIQDIWPELEVFFHGSVSFGPYKSLYNELDREKKLRYLEIYNATEGFFALQDQVADNSLMIMPHYGIFYEFIPEDSTGAEYAVPLEAVELDKKYSMVITTNSGLWRYKIGDTIRFTSTNPYRFKICGRTKLCINVFGEDLFIDHAEDALTNTCEKTGAIMNNFMVAPFFYEKEKKGYHEWAVEFHKKPNDLKIFAEILDKELAALNSDYKEKRKNKIAIEEPVVREVPSGTFYEWLKKNNKLGGQHKIPKVSNSREYLEELLKAAESTTSSENSQQFKKQFSV